MDAETQSLLDVLADSIGTAHILMMLNYRPEYEHHWGNKTYYTRLRLDPLGHQNAAELLSDLLGASTELQDVKDLIVARTKAIPSSWRKWSRSYSIRARSCAMAPSS